MAFRSKEFKKAAVQKYHGRGSRSVEAICQELGVSGSSLYKWIQDYGKSIGMNKEEKSPHDRTAAEKYKAVIEFDHLVDSQQQGLFLRREGFHTAHIDQWRSQMQRGLEPQKIAAASRSEVAELARENRDLKKELQRKTNALAETAALLVLKKKADLIWGTVESE